MAQPFLYVQVESIFNYVELVHVHLKI